MKLIVFLLFSIFSICKAQLPPIIADAQLYADSDDIPVNTWGKWDSGITMAYDKFYTQSEQNLQFAIDEMTDILKFYSKDFNSPDLEDSEKLKDISDISRTHSDIMKGKTVISKTWQWKGLSEDGKKLIFRASIWCRENRYEIRFRYMEDK